MNTNSPTKFGFNVEDQQPPQIINVPNNQALPPGNPTYGLSPIESHDSALKISVARKRLKCIKWCLIPLSLMQLLFIAPEAYPLIITMLFPLIGLLGILKINVFYLKLFGIYLILLSLIQIIAMIVLRGVAYIVLQTLFMLFEIPCAYICLKTAMHIDSFTSTELDSLKN